MENSTFVEMCAGGGAEPEDWKLWLGSTDAVGLSDRERLGLLPEEYDDLSKGLRSMSFYAMKRRHVRSIHQLWAGCYVKFLFELDLHEPHFEFGWVDAVGTRQDFCKIQCDDNFYGMRAVTVRIMDVMEILPYKERPLVYYKTMVCGDCNQCDRCSNGRPPASCPLGNFFSALLAKQEGDRKFLRIYKGIPVSDQEFSCCPSSCGSCAGCGSCGGDSVDSGDSVENQPSQQ